MFKIKQEVAERIKRKYKLLNIANEVGITNGYLSLIFNKKRSCPKKTAYCITKAIDENAEILDFFEYAKGEK